MIIWHSGFLTSLEVLWSWRTLNFPPQSSYSSKLNTSYIATSSSSLGGDGQLAGNRRGNRTIYLPDSFTGEQRAMDLPAHLQHAYMHIQGNASIIALLLHDMSDHGRTGGMSGTGQLIATNVSHDNANATLQFFDVGKASISQTVKVT